MSHKGKTVIVTGSAGGLGRAIAERFLADGANVVVADISDKLISTFKSEVASVHPETSHVLKCDVTSDKDLDTMFAETVQKFGKVDYVINNAGIMDRFQSVANLDEALWHRVIAVNLTAPTMISKRAVNAMLKNEGPTKGCIVNIASIAATRGGMAGVAYTASKHGLVGVTKNITAVYGRQGIRCNAILPGGMATNVHSAFEDGGIDPAGIQVQQALYPTEQFIMCDVHKIAKLVAYLCSDEAEVINGTTVMADGGLLAG